MGAALNASGVAAMMSASDIPSERLRKFLSQHRQAHVIVWLEAEAAAGILLGWCMFRADPLRPFAEVDRFFIESVGRLVIDAWNQNWLRQLEATAPSAKPIGYVQAILTSSRILTVVGDRFSESMRSEWPEWQGPHLPSELSEHLRLHRSEPYKGRSIVARFQQLPDQLVRVQLRAHHALDSISSRKREVALLYASGESQSTIAERLSLSTSTVNNYLGDIYRQLNVSDKAQLANLIGQLPE